MDPPRSAIGRQCRPHSSPGSPPGSIPLFILDDELLTHSSQRNAFLLTALHNLGEDLRSRGSQLIIRKGNPIDVLTHLFQEPDIQNVYAQKDYSPYAIKRDNEIAIRCLIIAEGQTIIPPDAVRKADGSHYKKYTPFSAAWRALPFSNSSLPAPHHLPACPSLPTEGFLPPESSYLDLASETAAMKRLEDFSQSDLFNYSILRDRMDQDRTSHLSIALKFGLLSPRQAYQAASHAINKPLLRRKKPAARSG